MFILCVAVGGCLKGPPVAFGITEDTGGHITYVLGAAMALAQHTDVDRVEIITRLIDEPALGRAYAIPVETVSEKLVIRRLDTGDRRYLAKEANAADRPALRDALIAYLASLQRKPDLIHAHFADAGEIAVAVRRRFGIPFVYTAHSLAMDKASSGDATADLSARIAEEDWVIGQADAIIASSRDEAERQLMAYPAACPSRIHRIAPGAALNGAARDADAARARELIASFLRDADKPIVLAIARPVAKKNLAGLVDLFANDVVLRERANLVILAGLRDGPDSGETEQREVITALLHGLDRHDLYGSFALPKRHSQEDVASLYTLARQTRGVFVNPALTEPYGLTLTEAAVRGLPVVATCHGGAADIVSSLGHGRVADPRDPAGFAATIRSLLEDRDAWTRASYLGRRNAACLSWDDYAERFMRVARAVVGYHEPIAAKIRPRRLLICDIDNTLTGCRDGARDFGRFLAGEAALAFGVATGRSLQEALRLLEEWEHPEPDLLVTSTGAEIYWREGTRLVPDRDYAARIDNNWDTAEIEERLQGLAGVEPQPPVEQRRNKRSYFADLTAVASIRAALADLPVRVVHSHARLVDILPDRAGKGAAMAWAARRLGISRDHVYAAGDSGNDLDMLAACRNPIVVANHSDELAPLLRSTSTYVSRRPHAGGVVEGMGVLARRTAA